jgi:hypothetical protein
LHGVNLGHLGVQLRVAQVISHLGALMRRSLIM